MTTATTTRRERRRFNPDRDVREWSGRYVPFDLVKEFVAALLAVTVLVVVLAVLFSSPDDHPVTVRSWANADPVDFAQTAVTELDGSSASASYGPPYNTNGTAQSVWVFAPNRWLGVHHAIDTARDFVLAPLQTLPNRPAIDTAIAEYQSAPAAQQGKWTAAYGKALGHASFTGGALTVPAGSFGPVPTMIGGLVSMARSGALDGALLSSRQFYGSDYTKPLVFIADGSYLAGLAKAQHLAGNQWGMMNETGNFPGQAWLWLYTMWYQVAPMNTSPNADLQVWMIMVLLTLGLALVPFIPGLRSIPRWVGLYRLIWRRHYRSLAAAPTGAPDG